MEKLKQVNLRMDQKTLYYLGEIARIKRMRHRSGPGGVNRSQAIRYAARVIAKHLGCLPYVPVEADPEPFKTRQTDGRIYFGKFAGTPELKARFVETFGDAGKFEPLNQQWWVPATKKNTAKAEEFVRLANEKKDSSEKC